MRKIKRNSILVCLLVFCSLLMSSSAGWAPAILEALCHQKVIEGNFAMFKSRTSASPEAEFRCFLKNNIVMNSSEFAVSYSNDMALFIIAETLEEYSGEVAFVFANTYGETLTKAILTVRKSE